MIVAIVVAVVGIMVFAGPTIASIERAQEIAHVTDQRFFRTDGMIESEPNKTTSESQSYGLLMAVGKGDQLLFDRVWRWTKENLQPEDDAIFAWLWQNGKIADANAATDADQDIAVALIYAYEKWGDPAYLAEAQRIIIDIWEMETVVRNGTRYLSSGNWASSWPGVIANPSYLDPHAYRLFAEIDPHHDWLSLVDSSYELLFICTAGQILPPDWCELDTTGKRETGLMWNGRDADVYSYDAIRVPYRVAKDYAVSGDTRAKQYLESIILPLADIYMRDGSIAAVLGPDGTARSPHESIALYGALLAGLTALDHPLAERLYKEKLSSGSWLENEYFYHLAWAWLGTTAHAEWGRE